MPQVFSAHLSETWLKAAVVGSLWASFEIIIGSFLHNMRIPFAGTILSFASVGLIIAFIQVWKVKGLVWRAGLIAALLKSISPSAIILGPMIGIFSEALIIELFIILFGRNLFAYILGGAFAVFSALIHKLLTLLVTYGFDLVVIIEKLYEYIIRQLGMSKGDPEFLFSIIIVAYLLFGMIGAILGYFGGNRALKISNFQNNKIELNKSTNFFNQSKDPKSSPWLLLYHLVCIIACLYAINTLPIWIAFIPSLALSF